MPVSPKTQRRAPVISIGVKAVIIAAAAFLAGCASTGSNSQAGADRQAYQAYLRSDPLGTYLAKNNFGPGRTSETYYNDSRALAGAALEHLGVDYKFGGDEPDTGFDCSGLVIYAAEKSLGLKLPRRSAEIARQGIEVKQSELRKGDLVFFNTLGSRFSHVGIYLGDKKFVHAPRRGAQVRVESMDIAYWQKRYNGARRLGAETLHAASLQ
ncbi:MAG: C40 family peptidase [Pusillimonas sp.]|nr:C40 family peptidase [Pusillimonas sp.]